MRDQYRALVGTRLFEHISGEELSAMLECLGARERTCRKGEFIVLEGDVLDCIGAVVEGSVQMRKEDVWGGSSILAVVGPGEVFGESIVCGGLDRSVVSFLAGADTRMLLLSFRRVLCTCSRSCRFHHRLVENMVGLIAAKNVQLMEKLEITSKKSIRERVLTWCSQQAQRSGSPRFTSELGRVELADYLCVDRSALTRELSRMKEEGLLDYERNSFRLIRDN